MNVVEECKKPPTGNTASSYDLAVQVDDLFNYIAQFRFKTADGRVCRFDDDELDNFFVTLDELKVISRRAIGKQNVAHKNKGVK